jgi:hypothetical protein
MTTSLSEDHLVGLVALGVVPWIGWTLQRGLREARLPIGRTAVMRDERPAVFAAIAALYVAAAAVMAWISYDLLLESLI